MSVPASRSDFSSPIASALERFLAFKRAAGCRYQNEAYALGRLDRFLVQHLAPVDPVISLEVIRAYVARSGHESESSRAGRLSLIRQVCRFLALEDPRTAVPGPRFLGIHRRPFVPRVLTREEGRRFLDTCTTFASPHRAPLHNTILGTALGLLYLTGLRAGEVLHLTEADIDLAAAVLRVRDTKFGKSRFVPVAPDVATRLQHYRGEVAGRIGPRPACTSDRVSYHSHYDRRLRDLPWQGRQVQLRLRTRRFRCRNGACRRKIFAECLPSVAPTRARESRRLCEVVARVGYALGGLPGARLLGHLGIAGSADTVLRRVKAQARKRPRPRVRVLGVDDWAWRKRQRYGTLLMDLEQGRVIDLLPDRSAHGFAAWLGPQGDVEIISRDRCGLYADGARQGAPAAQQITDRYHLVSNLAEALERDVQRLQIEARVDRGVARNADEPRALQPTLIEARRQRCRQARLERFQTVIDLGRRGHRHYAIAHQVGISAGTVSRWLQARTFPERQIRSDRRRERAPFRSLYARGGKSPANRTHYSSGRVASLLLNPQRRSAEQKRHLDAFLEFCPKARDLRRLALRFRAMLRWRKATRLATWMNAAVSSDFHFLAQFARVLRRDLEAVAQAITSRWSNGPVEGHINRLKMIKRQMYGRAGFELLRARVLPWESANALEDSCTESA